MNINGFCDPAFEAVRAEFERNFTHRREVGASVCATLHGRPVVDLWGGFADRQATRPWDRDTLVLVWSCTKGAVALCLHVLASRGLVDLDSPVARYWPEFASHGKDAIRVRWLLDHQAGVPVPQSPLKPGGLYDWDYMTEQLAAMTPVWEPGTRVGYHASTMGHLIGEIVRRVDGRGIGTFFREEVARPLNLDFHLGLPASDHHRVAETIRADPTPAGEVPWQFLSAAQRDPDSLQSRVIRNTGRFPGSRDHDTPLAYQAELPSQGGLANARALAELYTPLALKGSHHGVRLVDAETVDRMQAVSAASARDAVILIGVRFGLGFMKSMDNRKDVPGARDSIILGESAFGHAGMGGSLGFADPEHGLAFGYAMNKQGRGVLLNDRGQMLVDAVYRALGCASNHSGRWR